MRRLFKWVFVLILLPLTLIIIGIWAVFKLVPQEKFRARAAQELGLRLNRQVELGAIHVGLRGLEVEELRLSKAPGFQAGTVVTAKGLRLGWDWQSLWQGLDIKKKAVTRSAGRFHVDEFHSEAYSARDVSLAWSLSGLDPSWHHINGWVRLEQGAGLLDDAGRLLGFTPSAKLALVPADILANMQGARIVGLPDLRHWPVENMKGDYRFQDGLMRVQRFTVTSPRLNVDASGIVELASGALSLDVRLRSPSRAGSGALDAQVHLSGTVDHPTADLQALTKRDFKAILSDLLSKNNFR